MTKNTDVKKRGKAQREHQPTYIGIENNHRKREKKKKKKKFQKKPIYKPPIEYYLAVGQQEQQRFVKSIREGTR